MTSASLGVLALAGAMLLGATRVAVGAAPAAIDLTPEELREGEALFRTHCTRCHGMHGEGGEGANLTRKKLRRANTDEELVTVIYQGIPGTGMPGTFAPGQDGIRKIAGYVRSLGDRPEEPMPGDPETGRRLFEGDGGCLGCHIVAGVGRGVGPELTDIGEIRGLAYLREALVDPAAAQPTNLGYAGFLSVEVVTADGGATIKGMRINEDAFSIQIRDLDGRLHSFDKHRVRSYERVFGHSHMPAAEFSRKQLDDLVSYLMSLRGDR